MAAEAWFQRRLVELLAVPPKNGYSPKEVPEWTGTLLLGLGCLSKDGFRPAQLKNAPAGDPNLAGARVHDGDVLLSRANTRSAVGFVGVYQDLGVPCVYPDLMMRLVPRTNEIATEYLVRFLQSAQGRRQIEAAASGTSVSMVKLNKASVEALTITVPPLPEQRQIVATLDTVDDAIRKTEQIIAKLKQVKQGLLHDLLTRGIDDNGELRDPARHPEQFKDSALGRIPTAWEVSSVQSEFEIRSGVTLGPHRQPKVSPWPYLRVANVHRDSLDLSDIARLEARPAELADRLLEPEDLLVVEGHANPEEIGRCAMATSAVAGFTFQNHLFRLRANRLLPHFALLWMNSAVVRGYWRRTCASSSGLNTINTAKLRRVPVLVLPRAEQEMLVVRTGILAERLVSENRALSKLRLLKSGLMEDLLTGRVRVTPLLEAHSP